MRWVLLVILVYVALVVQNMLGILICVHTSSLGPVVPDILAVAAVFVVLGVRNQQDVIIGCWALGLGLDLTSAGGPSVVGPMALAYSAAAWGILRVRDAFFRDRFMSQIILSVLFALMAHVMWITMQLLIALRSAHWEYFGSDLLRACLVAVYTGLLAPIIFPVLRPCEKWLVSPTAGRGTRDR